MFTFMTSERSREKARSDLSTPLVILGLTQCYNVSEMANEFLNTPLIPGALVEPHVHRRLMVVFIIVVVLILIILGLYYFIPAKPATPPVAAPVVDQRIQVINDSLATVKDVPPASQTEIQASYKKLQKTAVPATQAEITNSLNQLKTQ
jgi:hypothetical protein